MVKEALISVAGLVGRPVMNQAGQEIGLVVDLVFRWNTNQKYPPLSGILVKVGRRLAWIGAGDVERVERGRVLLRTARLDLRDFKTREAEVRVAQDVLDHQLVDVNGARVVRASDLYVTNVSGTVQLVGVDVGMGSLLRRLGPKRWRARPTPRSVVDWAHVQSFGEQTGTGRGLRLATARTELKRLRPGELADLLEDLGRSERQELLDTLSPEEAADALEEMESDELEVILRESEPAEAAGYLANMEPDEAADALRDVDGELRRELLALMPHESARQITQVLAHDEEEAGGFMTTVMVTARASETVKDLRARLKKQAARYGELDSIVIVNEQGRLLHDLRLVDLLVAEPQQLLGDLITPPEPVTVSPDAEVEQVAELLIANRRSSVLVVNEDNEPIGRILADDVVDALLPEEGKPRFLKILS